LDLLPERMAAVDGWWLDVDHLHRPHQLLLADLGLHPLHLPGPGHRQQQQLALFYILVHRLHLPDLLRLDLPGQVLTTEGWLWVLGDCWRVT
jgi:hypothetical protein